MTGLRHRLFRLLPLAAVAAWFLCPLPQPSAIKTVAVERPGSPSSAVLEEPVVCTRTSDEMLLRVFPQLSRGRVQIDLLDLDGTVLAGPFVLTGTKGDSLSFVTNDGFPRGRAYCLRCTEQGAVGSYRLSVSQPWGIGFARRYVAAVSILAVGLVVTAGFWFFRIGGTSMRRMAAGFAWFLFLATFWLVYPMVHEAGHIVALRAFDAWQPGETSLLPLGGQTPHVSGNPSAHLAPWQIAITAIAGGLLPTLLGYISFALWVSPFGRRCRTQRFRVDLGWSAFTLLLAFPQAIPGPMLFPRLIHDRDYSLFIQNVRLPLWLANSALGVVAMINLGVVAWVLKHVFLRIRAARSANQAVQRTGASRSDQEINATSSAAGSRR